MKKEHIITYGILIGLWYFSAWRIGNDILLPYPHQVFLSLLHYFKDPVFWKSALLTTGRVLSGFMVSLILALIFSILSYLNDTVRRLLEPVVTILRTIPNVSYMILALIFLGAEGSVAVITCMILFPVLFNGLFNCLLSEPQNLRDVEALYPASLSDRLFLKILPQLKMEILRTGKTAASLGFKVGVMAEILGQVRMGLGRRINYAKASLDTSGIMALTIVMILISILIDRVFTILEKKALAKEVSA